MSVVGRSTGLHHLKAKLQPFVDHANVQDSNKPFIASNYICGWIPMTLVSDGQESRPKEQIQFPSKSLDPTQPKHIDRNLFVHCTTQSKSLSPKQLRKFDCNLFVYRTCRLQNRRDEPHLFCSSSEEKSMSKRDDRSDAPLPMDLAN
jgi:hypothetical protein